jgi:hypothetical protein
MVQVDRDEIAGTVAITTLKKQVIFSPRGYKRNSSLTEPLILLLFQLCVQRTHN